MKYRPEYDKKLIGENLRRCRQEKGLSVEQVREYLCIGSIQAIYKWEEGKSFPQADTMFALMELYEIGLQELLYKGQQHVPEKVVIDYEITYENKEDERTKGAKFRRLLWYMQSLHKKKV